MATWLRVFLCLAAVLAVAFLARRPLLALVRSLWARRSRGMVLGGIVLSAVLLIALWKLPEWRLAPVRSELAPRDLIELENSIRATLAQIVGGLVVLIGVYFTWRRVTASEQQVAAAQRQVEVAREGQITERFTRAIEHLGSEKLEVRLGGIYALERIAKDSERDHWTIMEVLTAYVRENAAWTEGTPAESTSADGDSASPAEAKPLGVSADVQAILTVLGRRQREFEKDPLLYLDLTRTDLRRARLHGAHLEGVDLFVAHLESANLGGAHLEGAYLRDAHLEGAYLQDAHLEGAHLAGANLTAATGLTREQIESAITDENTVLPDCLAHTTSAAQSATTDQEDDAAAGND